jgi:hypothetical protein
MGFCLFESALERGLYVAINPAYVDDVQQSSKGIADYPVAHIEFAFKKGATKIPVLGAAQDIQKTMMKATKIGIEKVEIRVYGGRGKLTSQPLVLNNSSRVAVVMEIFPDQLGIAQVDSPTASYMFMDDGGKRLIVDRPGTFAFKANRKGEVPVLICRSI